MTNKKHFITSEIHHVPMRDGIRLSVHVHRPVGEGRFPAIISYTPYCKGPLGYPDPIVEYGYATAPIVEYGYATVNFDIRGTGNSEGWNDSIYSDLERQDGYDMVEWAASQPWCNGNIGMWGISYGAVAALQIAMAAPPHLKAIIVRCGTDDIYTEWTNPGGSLRPYIYTYYAPIMTSSNFSPPDPDEVGERWSDIWKERLKKNIPWGISFLKNIESGPFRKDRSLRGNYDKIKCAVFVVDGWADWYHNSLLRTFMNLKVPKRALIGPWSHQWPDQGIPGPRIDWTQEAKRWFDYWLKGIDNGIMNEPPITLFIREYIPPKTILIEDNGHFKCENEWPINRTIQTSLYFNNNSRLSYSPPNEADSSQKDILICDPYASVATGMHGGGPFIINWAMPLNQRLDESNGLIYTSELLEEDLEVTGQPKAVLYFSSSASVTQIVVKLCDVAPDGTSVLVTKGFLNVTYRDSYIIPSFIIPNEIYKINIELLTCAYRFKKGHRIRIIIAGADFLNLWPNPLKCTNTFYHNSDMPSHLYIPVIPDRNKVLQSPKIYPSQYPLPSREELTAPGYAIKYDIINNTLITELDIIDEQNWRTKTKYIISSVDPAKVIIEAKSYREFEIHGQKIRTNALVITTSDARAFHHIIKVDIMMDKNLFFQKGWSISIPRDFV